MQAMPVSKVRKKKPELDLPFNVWSAGYMSHTEAIRARKDCLLDMTNMDMKPSGLPGVRPGTTRYGRQPIGTVIGVGTFIKSTNGGMPKSYQITMQVIGGVGKLLYNIDGGDWLNAGGNYSAAHWATFTQSNNRVYVSNGHNTMSYLDILTGSIVSYDPILAPATPAATVTGIAGAVVTYRYRVSANNKVGETQASTAVTVTVGEYRDSWDPATQYVTLSWSQVTGADSYNIYLGTVAGEEQYLGNVPQPSAAGNVQFIDNNRAPLNPFKKAPEGNSTSGPVLMNLAASSGQLYGTGDTKDRYRCWYSGNGDKSGSFSPFDGGGWVDINYGGDSVPVVCKAFRDGTGHTAVTILTKGAAGAGNLYHMTFGQQVIGNFTITYPDIKPANGQTGTYSPMAVVECNNSLYYLSGMNFKTTGTKPSMVNILVTGNIGDTIERDLKLMNLSALHKAVGMDLNDDIYFALPIGADHNTEIWKYSVKNSGIWILRWTIPCDYMWKYEDTSGVTHHCILSNNKILEFNESAITDDGVPFRTRLALPTITFDKTALQMAAVDVVRTLLIRPQGKVSINIYGINEDNESTSLLTNKNIAPIVDPSGWGAACFDTVEFDYVLPPTTKKAKGQLPVPLEVEETLSQLDIDITTEGNASYALNSVLVKGKLIPGLYRGDG